MRRMYSKEELKELAGSINSIDLVVGQPTVDYNTEDGITIDSVGQVNGEDCVVSQEIPLVGTDGITIDKAADSEKIEISGKNFVEKPKSYNETSYTTDLLVPVQGGQSGNMFQMRVDYHTSKVRLVSTSPDGTVKTLDPIYNEDAANKKYCDDNFVKKNTATNTAQIYAHVLGEDVMRNFGYEPAFDSFPVYGVNKTLKTSTPQQDTDAANKKYVDDQLAGQKFKTLFGNQSITGSGNIDLFRHVVNFQDQVYMMFTSSNSLEINSLTDLKTVLPDDIYMPATGYLNEKVVIAVNPVQMLVRLQDGEEVSLATLQAPTDSVVTV